MYCIVQRWLFKAKFDIKYYQKSRISDGKSANYEISILSLYFLSILKPQIKRPRITRATCTVEVAYIFSKEEQKFLAMKQDLMYQLSTKNAKKRLKTYLVRTQAYVYRGLCVQRPYF
jgi:hypothetical protein